jgi:Rod binding domain-containing protein
VNVDSVQPRPGDTPQNTKLKQVARQFEGIFLQELFKGLEKEPEDDDLMGNSQASQTFNELHHQALSDQAAGGMGIADLLYRNLLAQQRGTTPPAAPGTPPGTSETATGK